MVYTIGPILAKDEGCAKGYAKAISLSGIEQRKLLAEFFRYKCAEQLTDAYHGYILETKAFDCGDELHKALNGGCLMSRIELIPIRIQIWLGAPYGSQEQRRSYATPSEPREGSAIGTLPQASLPAGGSGWLAGRPNCYRDPVIKNAVPWHKRRQAVYNGPPETAWQASLRNRHPP
jgi:hypothetical protein